MILHHAHTVTPIYYKLAKDICHDVRGPRGKGYWSGEVFAQVEPNYRLRIECNNGQLTKVTIEKS